MRALVLATLAYALGLAGCSALGLDQLAEPHCTSDAQCDARNRRDGIGDDACVRWQCRDVCVLGPHDQDDDGALDPVRCTGANGSPLGTDCDDEDPLVHPPIAIDGGAISEERCNGADDDCDGAIDEAYVDAASVTHAGIVPTELVRLAAGSGAVSRPSDHDGARTVTITESDGTGTVARLGSAMPEVQSFGWARETSDATLSAPESTTGGCFAQASDGSHLPASCDVHELAVAETDAHVVVAGISTQGCADGQLRIGTWDAVEGLPAILRGPTHRSNLYLGVDLTTSGACSGGSRSTDLGAARPAISITEARSPTSGEREAMAMVAWLGASFDRPACGGAAVDVDALGVFVEESTHATTRFSWLTGTDDGVPRVLGRTIGGAPPAILRFDEDAEPTGWLVGHGDESGHLALHYVPIVEWSTDDAGTTGDAADPPLATPALDGIRDFSLLASVDGIDDVSLALLGPPVSGRVRVAVAYRRGCDAAARVEVVVLETEAVRPDAFVVRAGPLVVDDGASVTRRERPSLLYVDTGALRVGSDRMGATVDASTDGAIFVAWREQDASGAHLVLRRIAELDFTLLDAAPLRFDAGDARAPSLHRAVDGRAAVVLGDGGDLVDLAVSCMP
jgi:hypothetical protein